MRPLTTTRRLTTSPQTFSVGPDWGWLGVGSGVLGALLWYQAAHMHAGHVPVPMLSSVTIPTAVGWAFVGLVGFLVSLFSVKATIVTDREARVIRTRSWILGIVPIHWATRSIDDVGGIRIGAESIATGSPSASLTIWFKVFVVTVVIGVLSWGYFLFDVFTGRIADDYEAFMPSGVVTARLVFTDGSTWLLASGNNRHVHDTARAASKELGVTLHTW